MAEPQILDPAVARRVFEAATQSLNGGTHEIPGTPSFNWSVAEATFPLLKIRVDVSGATRIVLVLDCTNFDYDPPSGYFEDRLGNVLPWTSVVQLAAPYSGVLRGEYRSDIKDVVLYRNGVGLICRKGQAGYHEVHPEVNWRDLRAADGGRLDFIIDLSIRLLDAEKLARLL